MSTFHVPIYEQVVYGTFPYLLKPNPYVPNSVVPLSQEELKEYAEHLEEEKKKYLENLPAWVKTQHSNFSK